MFLMKLKLCSEANCDFYIQKQSPSEMCILFQELEIILSYVPLNFLSLPFNTIISLIHNWSMQMPIEEQSIILFFFFFLNSWDWVDQ